MSGGAQQRDPVLDPALDRGLHLGLDLGSTETKVVAYDGGGRALAECARPTPWRHLSGGCTETTGAALVDGAVTALRDLATVLRERLGRFAVVSLGVTGLGESGVLLGPDGSELAPVIAWFDRRGADEVARLDPRLREEFSPRTGLRVDAQASVAKLLWLRGRGLVVPAGSTWLSAPEHLVHALGGERVSEPSLASRTGLLDQAAAEPWSDVLLACGLPAAVLPPLRAAGTAAGAAAHPGLPPEVAGAVVSVAGHDHPVACVGAGATGSSELFNGCGTADTLVRSVPGRLTQEARAVLVRAGFSAGMHVLPGTSLVLAEVRSGLVLRRVLAALGAQAGERRRSLDALAAARPGPRDGVVVSGGRAGDDAVTLVLHDGASPDAVLAAALHHLGQETAALLEVLTAVVGDHTQAVASGGWLRMRSVLEAKQRVLPRMVVSPVTRAGCRGAALLGAAAAGRATGGLDQLLATWDRSDPTGDPAPSSVGDLEVLAR